MIMKKILFSFVLLSVCSLLVIVKASAEVKVPGKFSIPKVTRVEKMWVIPPDRRNFLGSRGIRKYDYGRALPRDLRGENYVVTLRYSGPELTDPVALKFAYRLDKDTEDLYVAEYVWTEFETGNYAWTLKNIGKQYKKKGKVDRWKVTILYQDEVVAEKLSATWQAMEVIAAKEETLAETIYFD